MATNDPNVPENVTYIDPGNKTPEEKDAPDLPLDAGGEAPELTAEEAAALAHEGEAGLRDIGEEQLEPPAPFDMGKAEKTAEPDKETARPAPEAPTAEEQAPAKKGRGGRPPKADKSEKAPESPDKAAPAADSQPKKRGGKPTKADKADKSPGKSHAPTSPEYEKALSDYQKELAEWENKQPWERSSKPPERPKLPKPLKKMWLAASNNPPIKPRPRQKRRPLLPRLPNSPRPRRVTQPATVKLNRSYI